MRKVGETLALGGGKASHKCLCLMYEVQIEVVITLVVRMTKRRQKPSGKLRDLKGVFPWECNERGICRSAVCSAAKKLT